MNDIRIEKSIRELARMKEEGMMATDSQCKRAFRLVTVVYCGLKVQDELEDVCNTRESQV
jgi:hypothetical protein